MGHHTVFVYGTLRRGEPNRIVMQPHLVRDLGRGRIRGALYDWGAYPAATLDEDGVIAGEWVVITDEGLLALDELEDCPELYTRTVVSDLVRDLRGWVYCMPAERARRGGPRVSGGDWVAHVAKRRRPR